MRLINTNDLTFAEFYGSKIPKYAILSHTWEGEEVTFQDWSNQTLLTKNSGYQKIVATCRQAKRDGYNYAWVDTNCINKSSSAELTEAINSMFSWYTQADICYAYLSDIPTFLPLSYAESFCRSRWFTRGWTLQELIAPRDIVFYAADWSRIGTKSTLAREIASASGISLKYLSPQENFTVLARDIWVDSINSPVHEASIAERMSWLSRRETTRLEDMAYCMLGLFGIHMPLVYGEGPRAFLRLQEEILKSSDDHTLFCWSWGMDGTGGSLLSPRPHSFMEASRYVPERAKTRPLPYAMTNAGLSIHLPLIQCWSSYIAELNVQIAGEDEHVGIAMSGDLITGRFSRHHYPGVPIPLCPTIEKTDMELTAMFVPGRSAGQKGTGSPSAVDYTDCRAGAFLSFGHRESFLDIKTIPPDRFLGEESILVICPAQANDAVSTDWVKDILQIDAAFVGATVVEITMPKEIREIFLFTVTTINAGTHLIPQWHCYNLTDCIEDLGVYSLSMESLMHGNVLEVIRKVMVDPQYAKIISGGLDGDSISVGMAKSAFTTAAASMLKHIHIRSN